MSGCDSICNCIFALQLMTDDRALYQWTVELEETGLFLVKDAVPNEDSIGQLAQRVAYLRRTNYGSVY